MATSRKQEDMIVEAPLMNPDLMPTRDPVVLSCGGMYIPQNRRSSSKGPQFHILNVLNENEPTKVISGTVPRNLLRDVLAKESMN
jgi:hypothetical protein